MQLTESAFESYIQTALWSTIGDTGEAFDEYYSIDDVHESYLETQRKECQAFLDLCGDNLIECACEILNDAPREGGLESFMHDFWLTRNGHGAGFWDGDYGVLGNKLTELAKTFGSVDVYVDEDNKVYFC